MDNSMLTALPSFSEIKDDVFSMNGEGGSGPDGFGDDKVEDFRPIALANFQFKIITKVLVDRLAKIAPKIISTQQRGFIKDRKIQDCICIASEAINLLDHKVFGGNLAIKLDIRKAFDTMDWCFLLDTLKAFGFCNKFCTWIKKDVLSRGIMKLVNEGKLNSISGPASSKSPSHVLYADDILIFCKGIKRELLTLKHLVNEYAYVSGYHINANKWKPKKTRLQPMVDKILAKLAKWKGSSLSIMGRVELVKSVIQSMLLYSFHIYKWPTQLLKNVDRKIRNFIWSGDTEVKKLEWARFYKNRFGCNRSTPTRYFKSSIWPGIKDHWHLVFNNSIWLVGERLNINFWKDNWLGDPLVELLDILPHLHSSFHAKVADFIHNSKWIIPDTLATRHPMINRKIASNIVSEGIN
ncbi:PREDICTED: uncharacterized protein LOC109339642 [Lupinus angustifolius]|uniref:uncharacterized protein LOC109339642 n=1 Tax=Lupinus angustifolius TaxID=3871 RepID=UPI00092E9078|nr:PREDICTED: uncharacterized protein LOC109339642 [Lupinus angustifolius]